ncbi:hypothetical protein D9613_002379 [Agrocybe pediades]|uniref:alpha-1,3-glucan synthase n=1 Tax=Agrocybe pediades TaxID=84607 RepID=A0A8H4R4B8_9AGAR|nr:hypothetical protein D9613_002379 [Agrocybe pediades]
MRPFKALLALIPFHSFVYASPWREDLVDYNLNINKNAQDPTQYDTYRPNHTYTPSPKNWRELPTYTILMDKFADGDPSNNDYFKTIHEYDIRETQLRYGGDLKGLVSRLDYLHGMGIRVIFMSGTPFLNMPWQADSYSPLDFSVLDPHWGTIQDWRDAIHAIHARGMYFMADFTVSTMSDLIGFQGHLNTSTPFSIDEYNAIWKRPNYAPWNFTEYRDFNIDNTRNFSCQMPKFWADDGTAVEVETNGCLQSDFDQFGDMQAFGAHPDWQRQLSKFASVQDRLREWQPDVMARIQVFSCIVIKALDIDAIRIDKATQITVDALAHWASHTRACAAELGKDNFFIPGEITGGDTFGSLYIGRGRRPTQQPPGPLAAAALKPSQDEFFLREAPLNALDGAAFHYSVYRAFTRFLGLDGSFEVPHDVDPDFVTAWNQMFVGNDFLNALHGHVDPRHMYGSSNFDVFRWPSLKFGVQKSVLATFIGSLVMPGIPLLYYGEEQNFYLYDNGASDYLFGRQAMISNQAWKRHGCYALGSERYFNMPFERALFGCHDDWNTLDHFDPTTDSRLLFAQFNYLRRNYGALQDGFGLDSQGKWTYTIQLPESKGIPTEMGLWSVSRSILMDIQENITGLQTPVYMLFTNENRTRSYTMNCRATNGEVPMLTPYASGTTVRNLFSPYETITLQDSGQALVGGDEGTTGNRGCIPTITMEPYSFKAFVPTAQWIQPLPVVTGFVPGHDARLRANPSDSNSTSVDISFEFNVAMSCDGVTGSLTLNMAGKGSAMPAVANVKCGAVSSSANNSPLSATPQSAWAWSATLVNFPDGVLEIVLNSPAAQTGGLSTGTVDHFMLRKGADDNVMVFPANDYDTSGSFALNSNGKYTFAHKAFGADKFRYSGNYGKDWSDWMNWEENTEIDSSVFSSKENFWIGQHIQVQYWSQATLSAAHMVHADLNYKGPPRRTPRFMGRGPFNNWGFDQGVQNAMQLNKDGKWELQIMASWPTYVQLNVWGFDDYFYGDSDGDGVLDRLPPNSVAPNYIRISAPPAPHLSWSLFVDDATLAWSLVPRGQASVGIVMYALLLSIPLISGILAVLIFIWTFYRVRHNQYGVEVKNHTNYFSIFGKSTIDSLEDSTPMSEKLFGHRPGQDIIGWPEDKTKRRKVLIATLEYEIFDWKLKVKIGGLGVMSSLMGKAMMDVDLIWVVPKVKDLEYPVGKPAEPIEVIIFGEPYLIGVETHVFDNITYVILDSPVFRAQTKSDPYPARMDNLTSAIFYSTWNQAIAATIRRHPTIDIYHINDYHGALAPIYLLPKVIPVCLSLHNAEFQGLWPLRTKEEIEEVCSAFNISKEDCTKYVQFGNTFNLLHAAASFISVHQKSVGVAGVSEKYGKRSRARYPALWILKHVDSLPNPDPSDIAASDETLVKACDVEIDEVAEAARPELKRQAQEWAGIAQNPNSDLFVFVGRWSKQKGVDLIADVMPALLEKHPSIQLIVVGPVTDLYGRFAVEKLAHLMERYPDRVYSKPEFTSLPPYLFSGADFALIPSRDEPFGLVAVEFGRKGALGVGSRLGGLGLMPGWWYPVESSATNHMLSQLTKTIKMALKSTEEERAILRARCAVQRFPVVEWHQKMETFHKRSINSSRALAGPNAWRETDCNGGGLRPMADMDNRTLPKDQRNFLDPLLGQGLALSCSGYSRVSSISSIVEEKSNSSLNKAIVSFTDADGGIVSDFARKLRSLTAENSEHELSIEKILKKSEETFFGKVRKEKLSSAASVRSSKSDSAWGTPVPSIYSQPNSPNTQAFSRTEYDGALMNTLNQRDVTPITRLQITMSRDIGGWPLYTIIIGLGQMLSATSFQITLLTGRNWQDNVQLYVLGGVFLAATAAVWYPMFRLKPSVYVLALPWIFFGLGFFLIGLPSVHESLHPAHRVLSSIATWCYAIGSAAGFLFFGLNFGEEAGATTKIWLLRACAVQGSQQIWVAALWYWGYNLNGRPDGYITPWWIVIIVWPLALVSFLFTYLMFHGLPEYYRQTPPKVPHFVRTLFRRKLVLWFLASEILRDYWLSGPYGRNWTFLWSVPVPKWQILLLVIAFFVFVWAGMLRALTHFSRTHDWLLPIFAVGLGAPRWCQMLWGTSSLALYIPWAGRAGPYLGVSLWLWLGVLDAIQGVGLGMILLQTLSRLHVCATLAFAQVIGSICVMVARATAPDALSPGSVFPDAARWDIADGLGGSPMALPLFWVALVCQLVIVFGYFWFYRKEQLARP